MRAVRSAGRTTRSSSARVATTTAPAMVSSVPCPVLMTPTGTPKAPAMRTVRATSSAEVASTTAAGVGRTSAFMVAVSSSYAGEPGRWTRGTAAARATSREPAAGATAGVVAPVARDIVGHSFLAPDLGAPGTKEPMTQRQIHDSWAIGPNEGIASGGTRLRRLFMQTHRS